MLTVTGILPFVDGFRRSYVVGLWVHAGVHYFGDTWAVSGVKENPTEYGDGPTFYYFYTRATNFWVFTQKYEVHKYFETGVAPARWMWDSIENLRLNFAETKMIGVTSARAFENASFRMQFMSLSSGNWSLEYETVVSATYSSAPVALGYSDTGVVVLAWYVQGSYSASSPVMRYLIFTKPASTWVLTEKYTNASWTAERTTLTVPSTIPPAPATPAPLPPVVPPATPPAPVAIVGWETWKTGYVLFYDVYNSEGPDNCIEFYFNVEAAYPPPVAGAPLPPPQDPYPAVPVAGRSGVANKTVEVLIKSNDTPSQVASKLQAKINTEAFTASVSGTVVTVTHKLKGNITNASAYNGPAVAITTQGVTGDMTAVTGKYCGQLTRDGSKTVVFGVGPEDALGKSTSYHVEIRSAASGWALIWYKVINRYMAYVAWDSDTTFVVWDGLELRAYSPSGNKYTSKNIVIPKDIGEVDPDAGHYGRLTLSVSSNQLALDTGKHVLLFLKTTGEWSFNRVIWKFPEDNEYSALVPGGSTKEIAYRGVYFH